jgi:4'-phosphopantetheinyl transferase
MITWLAVQGETIPTEGVLAPAEFERWAGFKLPKRRHEWLRGRWAAKKLLHTLTGDPLDHLLIANTADGVPYTPARPTWGLSISHSGAGALAAVSDGGSVGADMEVIQAHDLNLLEAYFTAAEQGCLQQAPPALQTPLICALWSGKEAALKTLGWGLSVDTRALTCIFEAVLPHTWTPFTITLHPAYLKRPVPPLYGWWRVWEGYVLTLASHGADHVIKEAAIQQEIF